MSVSFRNWTLQLLAQVLVDWFWRKGRRGGVPLYKNTVKLQSSVSQVYSPRRQDCTATAPNTRQQLSKFFWKQYTNGIGCTTIEVRITSQNLYGWNYFSCPGECVINESKTYFCDEYLVIFSITQQAGILNVFSCSLWDILVVLHLTITIIPVRFKIVLVWNNLLGFSLEGIMESRAFFEYIDKYVCHQLKKWWLAKTHQYWHLLLVFWVVGIVTGFAGMHG